MANEVVSSGWAHPHTENAHHFTSRRANGCNCQVPGDGCDGRHHRHLSAPPNWALATVGVLALTVAACRATFDAELSIHIVPMVCIVPSGMFRVCQEEWNRVQSKNPRVAGLRDPKTPPERPCCNQALSVLASRLVSTSPIVAGLIHDIWVVAHEG